MRWIRSWIAGLGDRLATVDIDGESAYVLREDLEELAATPATTAVRLLPGYDQWVLGPGTADVARRGSLKVKGIHNAAFVRYT
jgi:hypothetical protein